MIADPGDSPPSRAAAVRQSGDVRL